MDARLYSFVGGQRGGWVVRSVRTVAGEPLAVVDRVEIIAGLVGAAPAEAGWVLRGITSNSRYTNREEKQRLLERQAALGRAAATHAALIPIRKSWKWWNLTQDERRAIFEERSRHIAVGLKYLPAIARRLHHCRDLGEGEPFDFLTLFDYQAQDEAAFDDMVASMRSSEEWKYVEREVDIRLIRRD